MSQRSRPLVASFIAALAFLGVAIAAHPVGQAEAQPAPAVYVEASLIPAAVDAAAVSDAQLAEVHAFLEAEAARAREAEAEARRVEEARARAAARPAPAPVVVAKAVPYQLVDADYDHACGGDLPPCAVLARESGGNLRIWNGSCYMPAGASGRCGASDASGKWQFLRSTWNRYGGYLNAADAPASVQDDKARELWAGGAGCSHWGWCGR